MADNAGLWGRASLTLCHLPVGHSMRYSCLTFFSFAASTLVALLVTGDVYSWRIHMVAHRAKAQDSRIRESFSVVPFSERLNRSHKGLPDRAIGHAQHLPNFFAVVLRTV